MFQVNKVKRETKDKILQAIKDSGHALSLYNISSEAHTNYASTVSAVKALILEGEVVELPTSNGFFYIYSGEIKC